MRAAADRRFAAANDSQAHLQRRIRQLQDKLRRYAPFDDDAQRDCRWLNVVRHSDTRRVAVANAVHAAVATCAQLNATLRHYAGAVRSREQAWLHHPSLGLIAEAFADGAADDADAADATLADRTARCQPRQQLSDAWLAALDGQATVAAQACVALDSLASHGVPLLLPFTVSEAPSWATFLAVKHARDHSHPPALPQASADRAAAAAVTKLLQSVKQMLSSAGRAAAAHKAILQQSVEAAAVAERGDGGRAGAAGVSAAAAACISALDAVQSAAANGNDSVSQLAKTLSPPAAVADTLHTALREWAQSLSDCARCVSQHAQAVHESGVVFPLLQERDQEATSAAEALSLCAARVARCVGDVASALQPPVPPCLAAATAAAADVDGGNPRLAAAEAPTAPNRRAVQTALAAQAQRHLAWVNALPVAPRLSHASHLELETAARRHAATASDALAAVEALQQRVATVTLQRDNALIEVTDARQALADAVVDTVDAGVGTSDDRSGHHGWVHGVPLADASAQTVFDDVHVVATAGAAAGAAHGHGHGHGGGGGGVAAGDSDSDGDGRGSTGGRCSTAGSAAGGTGGSAAAAVASAPPPTAAKAAAPVEASAQLLKQREQLKAVYQQLKSAAVGFRKEMEATKRNYQRQLESLSQRCSNVEAFEVYCFECSSWNVIGQLASQDKVLPLCAHGDHQAGLRVGAHAR